MPGWSLNRGLIMPGRKQCSKDMTWGSLPKVMGKAWSSPAGINSISVRTGRRRSGRCLKVKANGCIWRMKRKNRPDLIRRKQKGLYYEPSGAIAAAATTSLPEEVGGVRNWDYRYTWVRDASFTLQALFNLGHLSETEGYLRWIERLLSEHGAARMQIMYGLRGEENLPEEELSHLDGYKGSRPVRIGNEAAKQRQLDIYGELLDSALKLSRYVGKVDSEIWPFLRGICNHVVDHWKDRDSGIWEVRGGPFHFVYSKVMCWVALDRGIIIAKRYGFPADIKKWERTRDKIKEEVLEKGWNEKKQAFVQHYDTDALDSSNLLLPVLGFLPFDDQRVVSTVEAIRRELDHEGFLYRYAGD
ncbi:MAG TPA: glycoside hydrolase family 15 protein, partial [Nitrospirae bacterium]|nr:glycoside hydrolase family 15 protein [Nitrospirota bacterium]